MNIQDKEVRQGLAINAAAMNGEDRAPKTPIEDNRCCTKHGAASSAVHGAKTIERSFL